MTKPTFAGVPADLERMARAAPGGAEVLGPATAPTAAPQPLAGPVVPPEAVESPQRPALPRREASQTMSIKVPKALYDELRDFWKRTDIPMTEVLVEGGKRELARLKAKYGIDG